MAFFVIWQPAALPPVFFVAGAAVKTFIEAMEERQ